MVVNKVIYDNNTLIDLSGDNVRASDVAQGRTFHLPDGSASTGTLVQVTNDLIPFINNTLTSLDLNDVSVYSLGAYTCYYKDALTAVNAPYVMWINEYCFYGCSNLATANFPQVQTVNKWALSSCGFTTLSLPEIRNIYPAAFNSCGSLTRLTLGSHLTDIYTYDWLENENKAPFGWCNALEELVINATTPPTLQNARLFNNDDSGIGYAMTNFRGIFVGGDVNTWKQSTNWSAYSNYLFSINDL